MLLQGKGVINLTGARVLICSLLSGQFSLRDFCYCFLITYEDEKGTS